MAFQDDYPEHSAEQACQTRGPQRISFPAQLIPANTDRNHTITLKLNNFSINLVKN